MDMAHLAASGPGPSEQNRTLTSWAARRCARPDRRAAAARRPSRRGSYAYRRVGRREPQRPGRGLQEL